MAKFRGHPSGFNGEGDFCPAAFKEYSQQQFRLLKDGHSIGKKESSFFHHKTLGLCGAGDQGLFFNPVGRDNVFEGDLGNLF